MSDEPTFEGFVPPTKNYFPMPNEWIDICSQIKSLAEIKVIFYILRHTWGYHEYGITKVISFDEFMVGRKRNDGTRMDSGTGLSRQSVIDGLSLAVKHGYIICEVDATDLARVKKSYALKMRSGVKNLDPQISSLNSIPQGSNIYTSEVKEVDSRGLNSTPRTEKDTIEKHLGKDTLERQEIVTSCDSRSDAPAADNLIDFKKATDGRMKAVSPSHSQADRGNDDVPTVKLAAIPKQTPAAGAAIPPSSDTGAQASRDGTYSTPAQRSGASLAGIPASPGAVQASVIPKRPRKAAKVTQAKPAITLTAQQQAFWDLWCGVWFNAEIKPDLTETAYTHVVKLAPYITTSEQLNSLIDFTRKDLADSQNIKRKMVQLGNMVHSYPGWKQAQQPQSNNTPARDENIGVSGLPRFQRREVKYG